MRFAYVLFTYLLSPVYAMYWIFRGFANRAYWDGLGQRLGIGYPVLSEGSIWIHAVSVGEVQATVPLVRALQDRFPERQLLITTVTPIRWPIAISHSKFRWQFGTSLIQSSRPLR
jgi:3-deoxy-D-manno-octulosonic-acid transferase